MMTSFKNFGAALLASVSLLGCGAASSENSQAPAEVKRIDGWGGWKFGMSFDEALAANPSVRWPGVIVEECRQDMAIKGCFLSMAGEPHALPLQDGLAFNPELSFNKYGKLTDIGLVYRHKGIKTADCYGLFERTLDRLATEHGPMLFGWREEKEKGYLTLDRKSPGGTAYRVTQQVADPSTFHTSYNQSGKKEGTMPDDKFWTEGNAVPMVAVNGYRIARDCSVTINYGDASKVERGSLL